MAIFIEMHQCGGGHSLGNRSNINMGIRSHFKFDLGSPRIHYTKRIAEEEGKIQFKRVLNSLAKSALYAQYAKFRVKIEKS